MDNEFKFYAGKRKKSAKKMMQTNYDALLKMYETLQDNYSRLELKYKSYIISLEGLPENRPLYKDSGLWQMRSDDMEDVLVQQRVNESDMEFLYRCKDVNK